MDYPIKRSGYVYNSKTSKGFKKMKANGIVMPPFRIEDDVTKLLTGHYDRLLTRLDKAIRSVKMMESVTKDSLMTNDGVFGEIIAQMQDAMLRAIPSDKEKLEKRLRMFLNASQDHFFENFLDDADDRVKIRVQFALDKDAVFQQRLDFLTNDYLGNSLKRIEGEEDDLKSAFLRGLTDYALGNSPDLESIRDVMAEMKETSVHRARFFARDQFAKLNKSLTLASFDAADVKKMQWIPVNDGRTRLTHKTQSIKKKYGSDIFPFNSPPEEKDDPNCRCAFIPVWED